MARPRGDASAKLIAEARRSRLHAYAPYSGISVGAAVLANGRIYGGCNVENASYGLSNCAERNAIFKAVTEGARRLTAIAIVTDSADTSTPCGACRQVMIQFNPAMKVIMTDLAGHTRIRRARDLLPDAFYPARLRKYASA